MDAIWRKPLGGRTFFLRERKSIGDGRCSRISNALRAVINIHLLLKKQWSFILLKHWLECTTHMHVSSVGIRIFSSACSSCKIPTWAWRTLNLKSDLAILLEMNCYLRKYSFVQIIKCQIPLKHALAFNLTLEMIYCLTKFNCLIKLYLEVGD